MHTVIIACKTIEKELLAAMEAEGVDYPIRWIDSGLHNVPKQLNARLQQELDSCAGAQVVLLAMSFCGNSVVGLQTHDFQLVIPRSDDCITLLLDSVERRKETKYTYFLTEGWLRGERNIGAEYEICVRRYGEKRGKRIFDGLFSHYRYLALVDTGAYDADVAQTEAEHMAQKLGLEYRRMSGSLAHLRQLLRGDWTAERFVLIGPNSRLNEADCTLMMEET